MYEITNVLYQLDETINILFVRFSILNCMHFQL